MEPGPGRERGGGWKTLRDRLAFRWMGCCASPWASRRHSARMDFPGEEEDADDLETPEADADADADAGAAGIRDRRIADGPDLRCLLGRAPGGSEEMNLAAALAAERQYRAAEAAEEGTPERVSLMRLLEERDPEEEGTGGGEGSGWSCCVCMGRRKGAAFIPCGHAFCRVCARELWLSRGSCPLCNRLDLAMGRVGSGSG